MKLYNAPMKSPHIFGINSFVIFAGKAKRLDWFVGRNKRDRRNDVDVM